MSAAQRELLDALRPLAAIDISFFANNKDDFVLYKSGTQITLGDVRTAKHVLEKHDE